MIPNQSERYIKRSFHPAAWRCVERDGDKDKEGDRDDSNNGVPRTETQQQS